MVKHPVTQVWHVPVEAKTQLLQGQRLKASRVKEQDFTSDKAAAKEAFQAASSSIALDSKVNTKASSLS